jgi:transcriptional regulator
MYTPRHFAEQDLGELDRLFERDPFVTLVTTDADGLPFASHLPVLYRREGERISIEGHWAKPNPQSGHDSPVLLIVHGPHHYVSPGWYPDKEAAARVPTWNCVVAHLHGRLQHLAQLRGIVGFRFEPQAIALKAKLSQNHPAANVAAAADALDALGHGDAAEIARGMRDRLAMRSTS